MTELKNEKDFNSLTSSSKLTVVKYFATWCGACKMLAPVFEKVAKSMSDKVNFAEVDIDTAKLLADKSEVHATPTIIYFKDGKEVARTVGFLDEDSLYAKVKSLM